jgi:hypothetical protein
MKYYEDADAKVEKIIRRVGLNCVGCLKLCKCFELSDSEQTIESNLRFKRVCKENTKTQR